MTDNKQILFDKFRDGDHAAFTALFWNERAKLYAFVYRLVRRSDVAEDIVVESLVKLWEHRGRMESIANALGFLYLTARNAAIDYLRKNKKMVSYDGRNIETGADGECRLNPSPEIEAEIAYNNFRWNRVLRALPEVIDGLPARQKKALTKFLQGWKIDEIAEEMSISGQTVHNHLSAAKGNIIKALKDRGIDVSPLLLMLIMTNL